MRTCPSPDVLAAFADGQLDGDPRAALERHLVECSACCTTAAALAEVDQQARAQGRDAMALAPGELWADRYVIVEQLGRGSSSTVYGAFDRRLEREVALKIARRADDAEVRSRWRREAQAGVRIEHPNVVTMFDVGEHDGWPYIAMTWVRGLSLRAWLADAPRSVADVCRVFVASARGLAAAHAAGLLHRDFKPDNVVIDAQTGEPRVIDFGLTRVGQGGAPAAALTLSPDPAAWSGVLDDSETRPLTRHDAVVGTPRYLAPELFDGAPATPASDQFAFCVAFYEALAGRAPFDASTLAALKASQREPLPPLPARVPRRILRVLRRGLAVDPAARYPSMSALVADLAPEPSRWLAPAVTVVLLLIGVATVGTLALRAPPRELAIAGPYPVTRRVGLAAGFGKLGHAQAVAAWRTVDEELMRAGEALTSARLVTPASAIAASNCLRARELELETLTELLSAPDAGILRRLPDALVLLGDPASCLGVTTVGTPTEHVRALRRAGAELVVAGVGRGEASLGGHLLILRGLARGLGLDDLDAALSLNIAIHELRGGDYERTWAELEHAISAAEAAGLSALRLRAYTAMIRVVSRQGVAWRERGEIAWTRADAMSGRQASRPWLLADLHLARGEMLFYLKIDRDEGLATMTLAAEEASASWGESSIVAARIRALHAKLLLTQGRIREAEPLSRRALAELQAFMAPTHPEIIELRRQQTTWSIGHPFFHTGPGLRALIDEFTEAGHGTHRMIAWLLGELTHISDPSTYRELIERVLTTPLEQVKACQDMCMNLVNMCADLALQLGDVPLAERAFARALELEPPGQDFDAMWITQHELALARGKVDEVLAATATRPEPIELQQAARLHRLRGRALAMRGRRAEALAALDRAWALAFEYPAVWSRPGDILIERADLRWQDPAWRRDTWLQVISYRASLWAWSPTRLDAWLATHRPPPR
jgi:tetratricopeptide (TPR) repeat protein